MNLSKFTVKTTLATFVNESNARAELANAVRSATDARAIAARNLVLVTSPEDRTSENDSVNRAHAAVGERLARLKARIASDAGVNEQERALFARIESVESRYEPVALNIVGLALDGRKDEAVAKMNADCRPLLAEQVKAANEYIDHADNAATQSLATADASYAVNRNTLIAACIAALALAVGLATLTIRRLVRALGAEPNELGAIAHRVAMGDLRLVVGARSAPKGSVLASLGEMQVSLSRVVGEVREASDSIATGSAQIATGNADLSHRTEQQASSLQETAGSMEQMNATVRNNADTARRATELAAGASPAAMKGDEIASVVVSTMQDISQSSKRIVDIIGVIAFQTNILSLNAAVEAARVGEQGRGFAALFPH